MRLQDHTNATHRRYMPHSASISRFDHPSLIADTQVMADKEANGFSSDNGTTSETDLENYIISEDRSMREYFLGKKYFEFSLATRLLTSPDLGETWPELDVCH